MRIGGAPLDLQFICGGGVTANWFPGVFLLKEIRVSNLHTVVTVRLLPTTRSPPYLQHPTNSRIYRTLKVKKMVKGLIGVIFARLASELHHVSIQRSINPLRVRCVITQAPLEGPAQRQADDKYYQKQMSMCHHTGLSTASLVIKQG
jgi:hypothetical protein